MPKNYAFALSSDSDEIVSNNHSLQKQELVSTESVPVPEPNAQTSSPALDSLEPTDAAAGMLINSRDVVEVTPHAEPEPSMDSLPPNLSSVIAVSTVLTDSHVFQKEVALQNSGANNTQKNQQHSQEPEKQQKHRNDILNVTESTTDANETKCSNDTLLSADEDAWAYDADLVKQYLTQMKTRYDESGKKGTRNICMFRSIPGSTLSQIAHLPKFVRAPPVAADFIEYFNDSLRDDPCFVDFDQLKFFDDGKIAVYIFSTANPTKVKAILKQLIAIQVSDIRTFPRVRSILKDLTRNTVLLNSPDASVTIDSDYDDESALSIKGSKYLNLFDAFVRHETMDKDMSAEDLAEQFHSMQTQRGWATELQQRLLAGGFFQKLIDMEVKNDAHKDVANPNADETVSEDAVTHQLKENALINLSEIPESATSLVSPQEIAHEIGVAEEKMQFEMATVFWQHRMKSVCLMHWYENYCLQLKFKLRDDERDARSKIELKEREMCDVLSQQNPKHLHSSESDSSETVMINGKTTIRDESAKSLLVYEINRKWQCQIDALKAQHTSQISELEALIHGSGVRAQLTELSNASKQYQDTIVSLEKKEKSSAELILMLRNDITEKSAKIEELEQQIHAEKLNTAELISKHEHKIQEVLADHAKLQNDMMTESSKVSQELHNENAEKTSLKQQLAIFIEDSKSAQKLLHNELSELRAEKDQLTEKLFKAEGSIRENSQLNLELEALKAENNRLQNQIRAAEENVSTDELRLQINQLEAQNAQLVTEKHAQCEELELTQHRVSEQMQTVKEETDRLTEELVAARHRESLSRSKITELMEQVASLSVSESPLFKSASCDEGRELELQSRIEELLADKKRLSQEVVLAHQCEHDSLKLNAQLSDLRATLNADSAKHVEELSLLRRVHETQMNEALSQRDSMHEKKITEMQSAHEHVTASINNQLRELEVQLSLLGSQQASNKRAHGELLTQIEELTAENLVLRKAHEDAANAAVAAGGPSLPDSTESEKVCADQESRESKSAQPELEQKHGFAHVEKADQNGTSPETASNAAAMVGPSSFEVRRSKPFAETRDAPKNVVTLAELAFLDTAITRPMEKPAADIHGGVNKSKLYYPQSDKERYLPCDNHFLVNAAAEALQREREYTAHLQSLLSQQHQSMLSPSPRHYSKAPVRLLPPPPEEKRVVSPNPPSARYQNASLLAPKRDPELVMTPAHQSKCGIRRWLLSPACENVAHDNEAYVSGLSPIASANVAVSVLDETILQREADLMRKLTITNQRLAEHNGNLIHFAENPVLKYQHLRKQTISPDSPRATAIEHRLFASNATDNVGQFLGTTRNTACVYPTLSPNTDSSPRSRFLSSTNRNAVHSDDLVRSTHASHRTSVSSVHNNNDMENEAEAHTTGRSMGESIVTSGFHRHKKHSALGCRVLNHSDGCFDERKPHLHLIAQPSSFYHKSRIENDQSLLISNFNVQSADEWDPLSEAAPIEKTNGNLLLDDCHKKDDRNHENNHTANHISKASIATQEPKPSDMPMPPSVLNTEISSDISSAGVSSTTPAGLQSYHVAFEENPKSSESKNISTYAFVAKSSKATTPSLTERKYHARGALTQPRVTLVPIKK